MMVLPFPALDPILLQIGPLAVRWYGLAYLAGLLLGTLCARRLAGNAQLWRGPSPISVRDVDDALVWAALGVVIGGRLGHVLIYDPAYFLANPLEILQVWHGGMAFQGGLIG